ncbi:MAG: hypothetical protein GF372_13185, partial [Candidatus Marinimicrobia bacterium]|nr:hypothetical protein [Candidatus Neomarinimicrobiota bacterium]
MFKFFLPTMNISIVTAIVLFFLSTCSFSESLNHFTEEDKNSALDNGRLVNEGYIRSQDYMLSWLEYADPETGLIPRNLYNDIDIWNAKDAAADNYPFMVLTSSLTDSNLFYNDMISILTNEMKIASWDNGLPDTYSFTKNQLLYDSFEIDRVI